MMVVIHKVAHVMKLISTVKAHKDSLEEQEFRTECNNIVCMAQACINTGGDAGGDDLGTGGDAQVERLEAKITKRPIM